MTLRNKEILQAQVLAGKNSWIDNHLVLVAVTFK